MILISPYSREIGGFRRDARLHDIFNPVDDRFFDVRRCEFTPTVLTIGNLSPLKNTLAVVQAAARLKDRIPGVRFRLAGRWGRTKAAYRQRIETVCRHAGLEETVEFIGFKNRDEIKEELARAACLFHPSFQENAPLVITEALTVGVPVVASRICGIPWMVQEGQTGFLFDPLRIDEMVDGLERILTDPERCERMGQAARRFAEENFRAEKVAARTIDVYRKAIADHQKEPQG